MWSHIEIIRLIEEYERHPKLWDPTHPDYIALYNGPQRSIQLAEIAEALNEGKPDGLKITGKDVRDKIRQMIWRYRDILIQKRHAAGEWQLYAAKMSYLSNYVLLPDQTRLTVVKSPDFSPNFFPRLSDPVMGFERSFAAESEYLPPQRSETSSPFDVKLEATASPPTVTESDGTTSGDGNIAKSNAGSESTQESNGTGQDKKRPEVSLPDEQREMEATWVRNLSFPMPSTYPSPSYVPITPPVRNNQVHPHTKRPRLAGPGNASSSHNESRQMAQSPVLKSEIEEDICRFGEYVTQTLRRIATTCPGRMPEATKRVRDALFDVEFQRFAS
ncbi:alcohol dehydrogenase transcription factor myb/SANT-like domain-containing protein [Ditylenchus destructor]|uniref:Alcohol dehydrogenase transcription factor myb/SANT-like domain-containing protein n=1 Tax=Ditylenchus destructor TaxID=166010 RepID=A0AAD4QZZ1_9BILA|nr:alcohol dehydrogenase transcription factor myb/SANT-like domain-containing protein [Ditylenchus destructor]